MLIDTTRKSGRKDYHRDDPGDIAVWDDRCCERRLVAAVVGPLCKAAIPPDCTLARELEKIGALPDRLTTIGVFSYLFEGFLNARIFGALIFP